MGLTAMNLKPIPIVAPVRADAPRNLSSDGQTYHDPGGRFALGNPGRPFGAKGKHNREMLRQVKELAPKAFQKLCSALDNGERWSVEYILDRVLPQSRTVEFEGATAADVKAALQNGDISTAEAKEMSGTLAKLAEISEITEMRNRLSELEKLLQQPGK